MKGKVSCYVPMYRDRLEPHGLETPWITGRSVMNDPEHWHKGWLLAARP